MNDLGEPIQVSSLFISCKLYPDVDKLLQYGFENVQIFY